MGRGFWRLLPPGLFQICVPGKWRIFVKPQFIHDGSNDAVKQDQEALFKTASTGLDGLADSASSRRSAGNLYDDISLAPDK